MAEEGLASGEAQRASPREKALEQVRESVARYAKLTERARKALTLAEEEARRFRHNYIGTEHQLLGLVAEGEGVGARVLKDLGVDLGTVRSSVEFIVGRGDKEVAGSVSLTPRAKRVMELAEDEARRLNHNYIGTEHLLLGLVREGEGIAAGVLESLGVSMQRARKRVLDVVSIGSRTGAVAGPRDNVITCRVDDADLDGIDALIEAGVRTTRSDAAAWLIRTGIEANQPLFEKVYATVAEIRRLREEAQRMIKPATLRQAGGDADEAPGPAPQANTEQPPPALPSQRPKQGRQANRRPSNTSMG